VDPNSVDIILKSYGDKQKRLILKSALGEPRTFSEIFAICKLPAATLYRKIVSLTQAGLLVENFINAENTFRKIPKYKTVFEDLEIVIHADRVSIRVKLDKLGIHYTVSC